MFTRQAVVDISQWYHQPGRKPLVIRGARQVGKTTAVRLAAQELGVPIIEINLERHPELEAYFKHYRLEDLLYSISLITGQELDIEKRPILFLDEAQATPSAYGCLRYFYEDMPELPVILTGSLLDQTLHNTRVSIPVGRIESYFMGPLTFTEFLDATGQARAKKQIRQLSIDKLEIVPDSVHDELLRLTRRYILTGGMPYCVQLGIDRHFDHATIVKYQRELVQAYKDDFAKYAGSQDATLLNAYFNGILAQVGQQFSHNAAIERFLGARLFYRVLHSNANTIPLGAETKIRISKFLFVDVGLLLAALGIPAQAVIDTPVELANRGVLAEQFVGQQLLYAKPGHMAPELYYWQPPKSEAQAEIDFLLQLDQAIYPVEVKSGTKGTLKSVFSYVARKNCPLAIRVSSGKPSLEHLVAKHAGRETPFKLLNVPFYNCSMCLFTWLTSWSG